MKLNLPPTKLVEKLVWVQVTSFCKISILSYTFDALLSRNWPFSSPNRLTLHITLISPISSTNTTKLVTSPTIDFFMKQLLLLMRRSLTLGGGYFFFSECISKTQPTNNKNTIRLQWEFSKRTKYTHTPPILSFLFFDPTLHGCQPAQLFNFSHGILLLVD